MTPRESSDERAEAGSEQARASRMPGLPTWESFAVGDRQRLVSAILQAARRQVGTRPVDRLPRM